MSSAATTSTTTTNITVDGEINKSCSMVADNLWMGTTLQFWRDNLEPFPHLHITGEDLIAALASEALATVSLCSQSVVNCQLDSVTGLPH